MRRSPVVELSAADERAIGRLLRGGVAPVRVVKRALTLHHLGRGLSPPQAAAAAGLSPKTARQVGRRYGEEGLAAALRERERPRPAPLLDAAAAQRIVALACGPPPDGRARWSVRLIAAEAVRRGLVPRVGRETIRVLLAHHDLKPWREKNVVRADGHARVRGADGGRAGHLREARA